MSLHLTKGNGAPDDAPPQIGIHYVDMLNKRSYFSVGTTSVNDWIITGGSGASGTFTALSDTPSDYIGNSGKYAAVNAAETGLEFVTPSGGGGGGEWGTITGTLSNQTDLQEELNLKEDFIVPGLTTEVFIGDKTFLAMSLLPVSNATQLALDEKIDIDQIGVAGGVAPLDQAGIVPEANLPSFVSAIQEYPTFADFPQTGSASTIYIALDTNKQYRWSGSQYIELTSNNAIWGNISGTLSNQIDLQTVLDNKEPLITQSTITRYYRGDKTFAVLNTQAVSGAENIDNTSDADKPISTATQAALDLKEDDLGNPTVSGYVLSSTTAGVRSWIPNSSGGGGGASDFLDLADTPATYFTSGHHTLRVNDSETGVEFYLLTADDVTETASRVFLSPAEKTQIATNSQSISNNLTSINELEENKIDEFDTGITSNRTYLFQRTNFNGIYGDEWVRSDQFALADDLRLVNLIDTPETLGTPSQILQVAPNGTTTQWVNNFGLEPIEMDLALAGNPVLEDGKVYLIKSSSTSSDNEVTLPAPSGKIKIAIVDIESTFEDNPVTVTAPIDGDTNLVLDVAHSWIEFYGHDGDSEYKTKDPYAGGFGGGGGSSTFDQLEDTPAFKTGSAGLCPVVNENEDALIYKRMKPQLTENLVVTCDYSGGGDFTNLQAAFEYVGQFDQGIYKITINVLNVPSITDGNDAKLSITSGSWSHITIDYGQDPTNPDGTNCWLFPTGIANPLTSGNLHNAVNTGYPLLRGRLNMQQQCKRVINTNGNCFVDCQNLWALYGTSGGTGTGDNAVQMFGGGYVDARGANFSGAATGIKCNNASRLLARLAILECSKAGINSDRGSHVVASQVDFVNGFDSGPLVPALNKAASGYNDNNISNGSVINADSQTNTSGSEYSTTPNIVSGDGTIYV